MSSISDMIESFIMDSLGEGEYLDISRNELANYFNVAPSQINYVLSTRFNYERGFLTESKRGGGGHITIMRADDSTSVWLDGILDRLNQEVDYRTGCYIVDELVNKKFFKSSQGEIIKTAISPNALANPFKLENRLRSQILRRIILKHNIKQHGESKTSSI